MNFFPDENDKETVEKLTQCLEATSSMSKLLAKPVAYSATTSELDDIYKECIVDEDDFVDDLDDIVDDLTIAIS